MLDAISSKYILYTWLCSYNISSDTCKISWGSTPDPPRLWHTLDVQFGVHPQWNICKQLFCSPSDKILNATLYLKGYAYIKVVHHNDTHTHTHTHTTFTTMYIETSVSLTLPRSISEI